MNFRLFKRGCGSENTRHSTYTHTRNVHASRNQGQAGRRLNRGQNTRRPTAKMPRSHIAPTSTTQVSGTRIGLTRRPAATKATGRPQAVSPCLTPDRSAGAPNHLKNPPTMCCHRGHCRVRARNHRDVIAAKERAKKAGAGAGAAACCQRHVSA